MGKRNVLSMQVSSPSSKKGKRKGEKGTGIKGPEAHQTPISHAERHRKERKKRKHLLLLQWRLENSRRRKIGGVSGKRRSRKYCCRFESLIFSRLHINADFLSEGSIRKVYERQTNLTSSLPFFSDFPSSGPTIRSPRQQYQVGETAQLTCQAAKSSPPTQLAWYINGEPVSSHMIRAARLSLAESCRQ